MIPIRDELRRLERERASYRAMAETGEDPPPVQLQWRLLNLEIAIYRAILEMKS